MSTHPTGGPDWAVIIMTLVAAEPGIIVAIALALLWHWRR
jgi:hypothetical protein